MSNGTGTKPTTAKPTPPSRPRPKYDLPAPGPMREFILRIMLGQIKGKIKRDPADAIEFIDAILDSREDRT